MRLYSFVNGLYLNQLQYGLQTAHCVSRLSLQNNESFKEWASNHETIIILDATNSRGVRSVYQMISSIIVRYGMTIPFTVFNEDGDSLDGATTCTAFVLPESIYNFDKVHTMVDRDAIKLIFCTIEAAISNNKIELLDYYQPEYLLFCLIKSYNLASH